MSIWLALAALAASPDEVDATWRAMQVLRVRPELYRVIKEPIEVREGPLRITLDSGVMIPVFSGFHEDDRDGIRQARAEAFARDSKPPPPLEEGDVAFVGFVFTAASGTFEVTWQERADHLVFANHQVTHLGGDRQDWVDVAHGAPWTGAITEGIVLGTDPALARAFVGPDEPEASPTDVVVYGEKDYTAARLRARILFHDRRELMFRYGFHPGRGVAWDRVADRFGLRSPGHHALIDLHIDHNLGDPTRPAGQQPRDVDWMTLLQDWSGALDARRHTVLTSLDVAGGDRLVAEPITGIPFPPRDPTDPTSPPAPPARLEIDDAYIVVQAVPVTAQLRVEVLARLELRAVGGDFQVAELYVPRHGSEHDWKLLSVTRDDGTSLLSRRPLIELNPDGAAPQVTPDPTRDVSGYSRTPQPRVEGQNAANQQTLVTAPRARGMVDVNRNKPYGRVTLSLPEPIREGQSLVLDVRWRDVWPYGDPQFVERGNVNGGIAVLHLNAAASGPQAILPRPAGTRRDVATRFRIEVVTPQRTALQVASSGTLVKAWTEDGWVHQLSEQRDRPAPYPEVHLGAFTVHDEPAAAGLPAVRTRTFRATDGRALARETRAEIDFLQGFLPPYPWPEHEIALGPSLVNNRMWWASGHGLTGVGITGATSVVEGGSLTRQGGAHTTQYRLVHELVHQWFGESLWPADRSDAWFPEAFAEAFATLYIDTLYGDGDALFARKRRRFETLLVDPLTRVPLVGAHDAPLGPAILFDYGPYLFHEMLRPRLGNARYHAALDLLARDFAGKPVTTEHIQAWFERSAGRDLDDFFDFWVYGGFVPRRVELDWWWEDGAVAGEVRSDVPFGTFEVPVVAGDRTRWVRVVDGLGRFHLALPAEPDEVALDPDHRILAIRRVSRRRSPPAPGSGASPPPPAPSPAPSPPDPSAPR